MKKADGSISIFLALTITMILAFCMILVESAREKTMLLKAEIVFDACVNSAMAEYHQILWEKYDVFYIDASYRSGFPNYEFIKNRFKHYANENLRYDTGGWLALSYEGATMSEVLLATDKGGADFFQKAIKATQIADMLSAWEEVASYINTLEEHIEISDMLEQSQVDITKQIEEANGTEVFVNETKTEIIAIENPIEKIQTGNALLRAIVGKEMMLSQKIINLTSVASHRMLAVGNPMVSNEEITIWDKALYCAYVKEHFGNYKKPAEDAALSYEMEYIICGKESDIQNLEAIAMRLLLIREADNYLALLQNEAKKIEAHALATTTANIATWLEPVVYQAILIYWAYEMSIEELQTLFSGGEIPLFKSILRESQVEISLNYEQYMLLLLLLQNRENLSMHTIDLIELFVRQEESSFRMDGCVSSAVCVGCFQDIYHKQYNITKTLQYD